MSERIVGAITGPVTKWVVLGFWLVMLVLMGPLTGKLGDVESHDNSDWLPADAESTRAIDELARVQDPDDLTTTIVYHREGGLTASDYTAIVLQTRRSPRWTGSRARRLLRGSGRGLPRLDRR